MSSYPIGYNNAYNDVLPHWDYGPGVQLCSCINLAYVYT